MLRKFVIVALLISVLAGSNQIVYAESGSASVKECLEKTEKCSESESTDSKEKLNSRRRLRFQLEIS